MARNAETRLARLERRTAVEWERTLHRSRGAVGADFRAVTRAQLRLALEHCGVAGMSQEQRLVWQPSDSDRRRIREALAMAEEAGAIFFRTLPGGEICRETARQE